MATRKFISILLVALILWFVALLPMAVASAEVDFYPKAAVVVGLNFDEHGQFFITVEDGEGYLWDIYWELNEDTNIELGDVVAILMWTCGTPDNIFDDEVIDVVNEYFKAQ